VEIRNTQIAFEQSACKLPEVSIRFVREVFTTTKGGYMSKICKSSKRNLRKMFAKILKPEILIPLAIKIILRLLGF
jgi:hypothetical protein